MKIKWKRSRKFEINNNNNSNIKLLSEIINKVKFRINDLGEDYLCEELRFIFLKYF